MLTHVRLDTRSPNDFIKILNEKNKNIQEIFLSKISELTKTVDVKVMMGDSTVTSQKTFDPKQVMDYFQNINNNYAHKYLIIGFESSKIIFKSLNNLFNISLASPKTIIVWS